MKPLSSGVAIALSVVLLVPVSASALTPTPGPESAVSMFVADPIGDLTDLTTGKPMDEPFYTDLIGLDVSVDDEQLTVRFDVVEEVPSAPDPLYTTVGYYLNIDTDGDGFQNYHIDIGSEDGWTVNVFDYDSAFNTQLGNAIVEGNTLFTKVPLTELGSPEEMRFQGLMQATDFPDPVDDPLTFTDWEDRVPDGEDEWLALNAPSGLSPESSAADMPPEVSKVRASLLMEVGGRNASGAVLLSFRNDSDRWIRLSDGRWEVRDPKGKKVVSEWFDDESGGWFDDGSRHMLVAPGSTGYAYGTFSEIAPKRFGVRSTDGLGRTKARPRVVSATFEYVDEPAGTLKMKGAKFSKPKNYPSRVGQGRIVNPGPLNACDVDLLTVVKKKGRVIGLGWAAKDQRYGGYIDPITPGGHSTFFGHVYGLNNQKVGKRDVSYFPVARFQSEECPPRQF